MITRHMNEFILFLAAKPLAGSIVQVGNTYTAQLLYDRGDGTATTIVGTFDQEIRARCWATSLLRVN